MSGPSAAIAEKRPSRTDQAIRDGFLRLLFSVRYDTITMSAIAREARVARSTLYEHYTTREAILRVTMEHLLDALADGVAGLEAPKLEATIAHFWDNRRLARAIFGPPVDQLVRRWLAEAVEQRLTPTLRTPASRIAAVQRSAGAIALLEQWLTGHLDATPPAIHDALRT